MRLSEAIRLGSMLGPQAFGVDREERRAWLGGRFGPKVTATCAYGAAILAAGQFVIEWAFTIPLGARCPACRMRVLCAVSAIAHLNDSHRWTRERIADWVQQFETDQPAEVTADEQLVTV